MQKADALVMPEEAPGPDFEYDDPGAHHVFVIGVADSEEQQRMPTTTKPRRF